jgi:hypothetical protein
MLANLAVSAIRTYVPVAVGFAIAFFLDHGVDWIDAGKAEEWAIGASIAAYYAIARALESWQPRIFGWLLGIPKTPDYREAPKGTT